MTSKSDSANADRPTMRAHSDAPSDIADQKLLLALAGGDWVSGEALADALGVTRAAVWKRLQRIESLGLSVTAERGRGYRLERPIDLLDVDQIRQQLSISQRKKLPDIEVLWRVDSTNRHLADNAAAPAACLAEYQTAGRGRRGRHWHSPPGCNIYLSLAWQFDALPATFAALGLAVGVVVAETLRGFGASSVELKWPNDIYAEHRKLGGILVEHHGEVTGPSRVVIGVGLNISMGRQSESSVGQPWISLDQLFESAEAPSADGAKITAASRPGRSQIAGAVLAALLAGVEAFEHDGWPAFEARWSALDMLANRSITIESDRERYDGIARGLDSDGALRVDVGGSLRRVITGDVSVRPR